MIDGKLLYPIGSIYMSIQDTNPGVFFGGTWKRIAKGKTLVGVDESDTDFNISSKTGGEKTHTLTVNEMPSHVHGIQTWHDTGATHGTQAYDAKNKGNTAYTNSTGGNQPHNNLQPYYTCYIFVRTA